MRKKFKVEHEAMSEKIAKKHPTINIDEQETKRLLIFHLLLEANTDLTKVKLLQDNIDSLNIADI